MKQFIPKVLSMTVSILTVLPVFAAADNDTKVDKTAKKPAIEGGSINSDKSSQSVSRAKKSTKPKTSARSKTGFVPPPPPSVPTLGGIGPGVTVVGEYIEYMNKTDLLALKTKLAVELEREKRRLVLNRESFIEKKKRSENFEQLFAEGVVSKRELEAAKQESLRMEDDLPQSESTVKDLESRLTRIEKRLKQLVPGTKKSEK